MSSTNNLVEVTLTNQAAQQVENANLAFEQVDRGVRAQLTKACDADGTTALTATEAQYRLIKLTGALTANETVTIPNIAGLSRPFAIWNATTGGYSILFKTVSGSSATIAPNTITELWIDTAGNATAGTSSGSGGSGLTGGAIYKSVDESVSTGAALQNDDALLFAMSANTKYQFEFGLFVTTDNNHGGLQVAVNGPASPTSLKYLDSATSTRRTAYATATTIFAASGVKVTTFLIVRGVISNGVNAGNLVLQWGRNTSSGNNTTVEKDSYLIYRQLT